MKFVTIYTAFMMLFLGFCQKSIEDENNLQSIQKIVSECSGVQSNGEKVNDLELSVRKAYGGQVTMFVNATSIDSEDVYYPCNLSNDLEEGVILEVSGNVREFTTEELEKTGPHPVGYRLFLLHLDD